MTLRPFLTLKLFLLSGFVFSLTAKPHPNNEDDTQLAENYIRAYQKYAIQEMEIVGMPASVILAQGMLESAYGQSELAQKAQNHFGLKCGTWQGEPYFRRTNEYKDGKAVVERHCFRAYNDVEESYRDHSEHIKSRSNYTFLFDAQSLDYKFWAEGLLKAGYATDPNYATKIINLIELYQLQRFDNLANNYKLPDANRIKQIEADPTLDTRQDILALETRMRLLENTLAQALGNYKEVLAAQNDLKNEMKEMRRLHLEGIASVNEKVNVLDQYLGAQNALIETLQSELGQVAEIQKSMLKSDPLAVFFNEDGTPKKQLDIFPTRHRNRDGVFYQNGRKTTSITQGQSFNEIAQVYGIDTKDLLRYNDLNAGDELALPLGCYVYLEPKANNASGENGPHTVQAGETLHSISQRYGVKLGKLYQRNNLKKGEEPAAGEFIFLNETQSDKPRLRINFDESSSIGTATDRFGGGGSGRR